MTISKTIHEEIKRRVAQQEPDAKIILNSSYARGDANEESDIDLLILVHKDTLSFFDKKKINYPLFRLAYKEWQIINPLVKTKTDWENKCHFTPLYYNIKKEGKEIWLIKKRLFP